MVLYGLTVQVYSLTNSTSAVSLLILTFLVPAVLLSAVAGVYVDRLDRRLILIVTNLLRAVMFGLLFFIGNSLIVILILNVGVSTVTTFFAPAEAAMIPVLVKRNQLLAANGIFTLTLNAAFALGFALLGPLVVNLTGPQALLLVVAAFYLLAMGLTITLPSAPPATDDHGHGLAAHEAGAAAASTFGQLREGIAFIRANRNITWSLIYLGITASLIGVAGRRRPGVRQPGPGPLRQGLRGDRAAPRDRRRDRDPAPQQLRQADLPPADDRDRPDPARHLPGAAVGGRPDHPLPAARQLGLADRCIGAGHPPVGRDRARLPGRHRLRQRRDPGPDPAPGGPARGGPRAGSSAS